MEFLSEVIGEGGMKQVYFTRDRTSVICLFKDQSTGSDLQRLARLEAILGKYNPTSDPKSGEYFKKLFCWPTGIVIKPQLGVMTPAYPSNYFFASGPFKGKEKEGLWFSSPKLRALLPDAERGDWTNYFRLCILMARAARRLHQAGLAHSDLSNKNVLIDPVKGECVVIDIDSLVVPQLFPPDVLGTRGYIAPEVLASMHLPLQDPQRKHPSARTDQHALAVLIYQYLLFRHPLQGPRTFSASSGEEQERMEMGSHALYIEHPTDRSNRPKDLKLEASGLGPILNSLFQKAFVQGLHAPDTRPSAYELEGALVRTWDLLHPCAGRSCPRGLFVLHDPSKVVCPACKTRPTAPIPVLKFRSESRPGQWFSDGQLVVHHNLYLMKWHAFKGIFPGEVADRTPQAYCVFHQGKWLLINQNLTSLTSPGGNRVPPGQAVELKEGAMIRLSQEPGGKIAEVEMARP